MLQVKIFLRNHSPLYRWEQLPDDVKRLFTSPDGSLVWGEFYIADLKRRQYYFEFAQGGLPEPRRHRADMVMLQDTWELLTLITYPRKNGRTLESISLNTTTIESAIFKAHNRRNAQ